MAQRLLLIAAIASIGLSPLLGQRDTIQADVDLVVVPVSVKDADGRLIHDLKKEDFSIFEDGRRQQIQQFSIDPAPLSTVVLVDTGIAGSALRRFSKAIGALSSAFTPMDEVEAYRFQKYVAKLSDFTSDREKFGEQPRFRPDDIGRKRGRAALAISRISRSRTRGSSEFRVLSFE